MRQRILAWFFTQSPFQSKFCLKIKSQGPDIELYLAEEAIGLAKSVDWEIAKGPEWEKNA